MTSDEIRCTTDEMVLLRPLGEMSTSARHAATRWLWEHGITPSTVAIGLSIERDDVQQLLVWREQRADGSVVKRWRFAAHDGAGSWPAAFPSALTADVRRPAHADRTADASS